MAHKKGVGSTDNGRDSNPKYLGVKIYGGQTVKAGNIIIRQRGTKYHAGQGTYLGRDFTLHAKVDGVVSFRRERKNRMFVYVTPDGTLTTQTGNTGTPNGGGKKVAKPELERPAPAAPMAAAAPAMASGEKITLPSGKSIKQDDLKMVEGIGPKIEGLLNAGGIVTWNDLAEAPVEKVQAILDEAGPRYRMHQPKTWAKQARMADEGKWEELETYQDWLDGGREPEEK